MIRRNMLGHFFTIAVSFCLLAMVFIIGRTFDFSADWIDGPTLSEGSWKLVGLALFLMSVIVLFYSGVGQFISKARKHSGFAVFLLFCTWFAVGLLYIIVFFDVLFDPQVDEFGAMQQVATLCLGIAVFAGTWLYTLIKFPEYKDVEIVREIIEQEVDRAIYKPDLSCGKCGEGLKDVWEFCPNCGGLVLGDDSVLVDSYDVIVEEDMSISTPPPPPKKKRGLFGRKKKDIEPEDTFEPDEDNEPELEEDVPEDEDFIDDFKKEVEVKKKKPSKKEKKPVSPDPVTQVQCDKCDTLLEIRNTKRPLNIRCPTCKNIWLLE